MDCVSRKYASKLLQQAYDKHVANVKAILKEADWICLTADIWSTKKK